MATDHGCVDSAGRGDGAKEGAGGLRKGQCGIRDDDVGISDLRQTPVSKECSCAGGSSCFEYPISGDKGQIVRACLFKAGEVRDGSMWRPHKLSADYLVDLSECDRSACVALPYGIRISFCLLP